MVGKWFEEDKLVTGLRRFRRFTGLAIVITVSVMSGYHGLWFYVEDLFDGLVFGTTIAAVAFAATAVFIVIVARQGARGPVAKALLVPLITLGVITAGVATFLGMRSTGRGVGRSLLVALLLGVVAYGIVAGIARIRGLSTTKGHPVLSPVAETAIAWVLPQVLRRVEHDLPPTDLVGIAVFYGGAVTVTLLAAFEIFRARQSGLDLRGAPPPVPMSPGSRATGQAGGKALAPAFLVPLAGTALATVGTAALLLGLLPAPVGAPVRNAFFLPYNTLATVARLSPDGTRLALIPDAGRTYLMDTGNGSVVQSFSVPMSHPMSIAFSPDGQMLAESGFERIPNTGEEKYSATVVLRDISMNRPIATWSLPESPRRDEYFALAFSSDRSHLAVGLNNQVVVFDTTTGQSAATFAGPGSEPDARVVSMEYLPGDTIMLIHTAADSQPADNLVFVDAATGQVTHLPGTTVDHIPGEVYTLLGDGSSLAALGLDGQFSLWDLHTGTTIRTATVASAGDNVHLVSAAISPDGSLIAFGDSELHTWIFSTVTGGLITTLYSAGGVFGLAPSIIVLVEFAKDSPTLLSWDGAGGVVLWDLAELASPAS